MSRPRNHDFGGLDERDGGVAGLEGQLADGVGGDDGRDALIADREHHLGEQAVDGDFDDRAEQLVAAADARSRRWAASRQELLQRLDGNAVMATGRLDGADAAGEDPVLERRGSSCRAFPRPGAG